MNNLQKLFDAFDNRGMIKLNQFNEVFFEFRYNEKGWNYEEIDYDDASEYDSINDAPDYMTIMVDKEYSCYFLFEDSSEVLKEKVLSWLSRPAHKEGVEGSRLWLLDGINKYLGTSFNTHDIDVIYGYLGNDCNKEKRAKFIASGYNFEALTNDEFEIVIEKDIHKELYRDKNTVEDILMDGMVTDGGHHKQWFLYQAFLKLGYTKQEIKMKFATRHECKTVEEYEEEYGEFDEGIPD